MISLYFDGLCRPRNPGGIATYGYVIYQDGKKVKSGSGVIGSGVGMTNNVAEYSALKRAVEWVSRNCVDGEIVIKGDSQLVIHQMNGYLADKIRDLKNLCRRSADCWEEENEIYLDTTEQNMSLTCSRMLHIVRQAGTTRQRWMKRRSTRS
jgi:ribonuclease HI